jgi:hypothetical protein
MPTTDERVRSSLTFTREEAEIAVKKLNELKPNAFSEIESPQNKYFRIFIKMPDVKEIVTASATPNPLPQDEAKLQIEIDTIHAQLKGL